MLLVDKGGPAEAPSPAQSTMLVPEAATGAIEIRTGGRRIRWSEISEPAPKPTATPVGVGTGEVLALDGAGIIHGAAGARSATSEPPSCRAPEEAANAAGTVDAQTRPPRLAKRADAFRTASTAITRGHFYFAKNGDISISP